MNARIRLALRAERAMGVRSVPIRMSASIATATQVVKQAAAATRGFVQPVTRANPIPAPATTKPAAVKTQSLFQTPSKPVVLPTEPFTTSVLARQEKFIRLQTLDEQQVSVCTKCDLHKTRNHTAFGEGDPDAQIMFIGEGPGENEDLQGRPFVGKAGQLLDKMIVAMGLTRQAVYICNIVKCRPPENRLPSTLETKTCTPYLLEQIELVRPKIIVTLGLPATQYLLQSKLSMSKLRGQWHEWRGIFVMPTYHPAYVLRYYTKDTREAVWSDLKQVMTRVQNDANAHE